MGVQEALGIGGRSHEHEREIAQAHALTARPDVGGVRQHIVDAAPRLEVDAEALSGLELRHRPCRRRLRPMCAPVLSAEVVGCTTRGVHPDVCVQKLAHTLAPERVCRLPRGLPTSAKCVPNALAKPWPHLGNKATKVNPIWAELSSDLDQRC